MAFRLPFFGRRQSSQSKPSRQFDGAPKPIDQLFAELYGSTATGRVTRSQALSVPAVQRGRNLLCSISTLPLVEVDARNQVQRSPLLEQFDPDVPNVVHLAQTLEDLVFESVAWWQIVGFGWDGFPVKVRRVDPGTVTLNPPLDRSPAYLPGGIDPRGKERVVWVDGREVPFAEIIRFDSPNPAVLHVGASAIRRAILLDQAAKVFAENPPPGDYFRPGENAGEMTDKQIENFLNDWKAARRKRSTAWVPNDVEYGSVSAPSPRELQLRELQQQAAIEIANMLGLDPEELGVSTTSRTYANVVDRRQDKINDVLSPYMRAITDRLSMGDVTRRGHFVRFDLDDYLKANAAERWSNYKIAKEIGVMDAEEIRAEEGLPPGAPEQPQQPAQTAPSDTVEAEPVVDTEVDAATATGGSGRWKFDGRRTFEFDVPLHRFKVDVESRTIEGLVLPYNETANKYGFKFRFARGSLSWSETSRVKLTRDHDKAEGVATHLADRRDGMFGKFKVARGASGDELLQLADDGVYDGLSVGVDFDVNTDTSTDPKDESVMVVNRAVLREVALTALPAFDSARVAKVAASMTQEDSVPDTNPAPAPQPEPTPAAVPAPPLTLSDETPQLPMLRPEDSHQVPYDPAYGTPAQVVRQFVNPYRPVGTLQVSEPPSYRFTRGHDGKRILQAAAHDFGMDLVRAMHPQFGNGRPDTGEYKRVLEFIRAQFDVASGDVNELNPTINIARYVDDRPFAYPIWNAVNRGAPPNGIQPFSWPKFLLVTGNGNVLVKDHTEGQEPTSAQYITTSQTVTPTPLSGKTKITRETWDMGGTPGLSDILWQRIQRDWFENLEAAVVTTLDNATPTSLGSFTIGGGTGHATLVSEMRRYLALLQFARGGFRFDVAFAEAGLYTHLADATDTTGRVLLPQVNPQNADGDAAARWATLNVGGIPFHPAWALGATVGTVNDSSYLIDRTAVDGWATSPQRLLFDNHEVAHVYLGVWGYKATAINDINGVREIIYDPA